MDNRIYVRGTGTGDGLTVVGQIQAPGGTTSVTYHDNLSGLTMISIADDIVVASGADGISRKEYAFNVYVSESNVTGIGYPTGTGCFPFE